MTAMVDTVRTAVNRIPAWLIDAVFILALGLGLLQLREAGVIAPDVTLPLLRLV